MLENDFINTKNTSYTIEAKIETDGAANGVLLAQGGRFGGYSLYVKDGTPVFAYNYLGLDTTKVKGSAKLPKGPVTVTMDFAYAGGGMGKGGTVTLSVNGKSVGSGEIPKTQPNIYSADETAGVGIDMETPVSDDYTRSTSKFTGKIHKVTVSTGAS